MKILKNKLVLIIEEARPEDALEIINFTKQVGTESNNLGLDEQGIDKTKAQEAKYLTDIKQIPNNIMYVGKIAGKIVSVGGVHGNQRKKLKHNVDLDISVLKDYWNIGVATHMLEHILNYCRVTKEIENVVLEVREDNEFAVELYKKKGFMRIGKYSKNFKVDGEYFDALIMELLL